MTTRTESLSDELHAYVVAHGSTPDPIVADLIAETAATLPQWVGMQIAPEQAGFLTLLARIAGARYAVEVGTFTGLSSIAIARGMGSQGRLVCCDLSEDFTAIARRYWARAGLSEQIELRLGPAADTPPPLPPEEPTDPPFLDPPKTGDPPNWHQRLPPVPPAGPSLPDT